MSTIVVGGVVNVLLTEDDFGTEIDECKQLGLVQSMSFALDFLQVWIWNGLVG